MEIQKALDAFVKLKADIDEDNHLFVGTIKARELGRNWRGGTQCG